MSATDLSREIVEDNIKMTMDDFMSALNEVKPAFGAAINVLEMCRFIFPDYFQKNCFQIGCRNPTLAKCGGEAQHLEKVRIWSPPGLPNVQSSKARPKTPRIGVFLVSLERS